jgi:hypothetical protein
MMTHNTTKESKTQPSSWKRNYEVFQCGRIFAARRRGFGQKFFGDTEDKALEAARYAWKNRIIKHHKERERVDSSFQKYTEVRI